LSGGGGRTSGGAAARHPVEGLQPKSGPLAENLISGTYLTPFDPIRDAKSVITRTGIGEMTSVSRN
jgi:hypothetical protein